MRAEERVVDAYASEIRQRVIEQLISALTAQPYRERLSGDDSKLNIWEEICFQVQHGESAYWSAYQLTLDQQLLGELESLKFEEQLALWLRTDEGFRWIEEHFADEDSGRAAPLDMSDVLGSVRTQVLMRAEAYELPGSSVFHDSPTYKGWWFPITPGLNESERAALAVPFNGDRQKMNLGLLMSLLIEKLQKDILSAPNDARGYLEMSAEHAPELLQISQMNPVKDWAAQIVYSDLMNALLNKIDWNLETHVAVATQELDTISLHEFLEVL
jgi:hypothetical protein